MVSSGGKLVAHGVGGGAYIPNHTKFRCGDTAPNIQQSSGHQAPPMRQNQKRLGKGRCNFFLAAWRGKSASACFIKPPVWAIVRNATAGTDKREPRADLSIHLRIRRLVNVNKNYNRNHLSPLDLSWVSTSFQYIAIRYHFEGGTRISIANLN